MKRTVNITLALLLSSVAFASVLWGGPAPSSEVVSYEDVGMPDAPDIIFSNLDPMPGQRYNQDSYFPIAGKDASGETESSSAILIIPKTDVQAKLLLVALNYVSGTQLVNIGLYTENEFTHSVGDPLPGGQGTITRMPAVDQCCQLAKVALPGDGVLLSAGVHYWLALTPDDLNAPTFRGDWHLSNQAASAGLLPPFPWEHQDGQWPAAQIRGTEVQSLRTAEMRDLGQSWLKAETSSGMIAIFSNLGPTSTNRFDMFNSVYVAGKSARDSAEVWLALSFIPHENVHAKRLGAAITYVSGTKLINLGLYADDNGVPGNLLPEGQGSTTDIPDAGECCQLTRVKLPGSGVALQKGVKIWLVASTDDRRAPDFEGFWHASNLAVFAFEEPEQFISWTSATGGWLAAAINGTSP